MHKYGIATSVKPPKRSLGKGWGSFGEEKTEPWGREIFLSPGPAFKSCLSFLPLQCPLLIDTSLLTKNSCNTLVPPIVKHHL